MSSIHYICLISGMLGRGLGRLGWAGRANMERRSPAIMISHSASSAPWGKNKLTSPIMRHWLMSSGERRVSFEAEEGPEEIEAADVAVEEGCDSTRCGGKASMMNVSSEDELGNTRRATEAAHCPGRCAICLIASIESSTKSVVGRGSDDCGRGIGRRGEIRRRRREKGREDERNTGRGFKREERGMRTSKRRSEEQRKNKRCISYSSSRLNGSDAVSANSSSDCIHPW
jgi:hypothetical protein